MRSASKQRVTNGGLMRKKPKAPRRRLRREAVFAPPMSNVMPARNIKLRFIPAAAGTTSVTLQRLLAAAGAVNSAPNTWTVIHNSLRVNSISCYGAGVVGEKIRLAWTSASDIYSSNKIVSDVCSSVSIPAYVHDVPPEGEDVAGWLTASAAGINAELFRLTVPLGTTVDISLTLRGWTGLDNSTVSTAATVAGGGLGALAYISFNDAVNLQVQDLPTVT